MPRPRTIGARNVQQAATGTPAFQSGVTAGQRYFNDRTLRPDPQLSQDAEYRRGFLAGFNATAQTRQRPRVLRQSPRTRTNNPVSGLADFSAADALRDFSEL